MSPLTKVFVFTVTLLSVLLVSLTVPFVAQVNTLNEQRESAEAQAAGSELTIRSLREQNASLNAQLEAGAALQSANAQQLEATNLQLQAELRQVRDELNQERQARIADQATISSLSGTSNVNSELVADLQDQLRSSQQRAVEVESRITEVVTRNNELESLAANLNAAVRRLQEELQAASEGGAAFVLGGNTGTGTAAGGTVGAEPVFGRITDIAREPSGTLVQLNIGSVDGVANNQRFVAYRNGSELVGRVRVQSVDERVAIAVVESDGGLQAGDAVVALGL